jgi:outer membrane protein assembly factor BamE (lipoprotein component of BamABCDE complex)
MLKILSLCSVCLVMTLSLGCDNKKTTAGGTSTTAGRKQMSRDDFEKLVKGKTANEVIAAVGQPDQKLPVSFKTEENWMYIGATVDPSTNKPDLKATVTVDKGHVLKVEFTPAS